MALGRIGLQPHRRPIVRPHLRALLVPSLNARAIMRRHAMQCSYCLGSFLQFSSGAGTADAGLVLSVAIGAPPPTSPSRSSARAHSHRRQKACLRSNACGPRPCGAEARSGAARAPLVQERLRGPSSATHAQRLQ